MGFFTQEGNSVIFRENGETVKVCPWGENSLRVRSTILQDIQEGSVALLDEIGKRIKVSICGDTGIAGKIGAPRKNIRCIQGISGRSYLQEQVGDLDIFGILNDAVCFCLQFGSRKSGFRGVVQIIDGGDPHCTEGCGSCFGLGRDAE